MMAEGLLAMTVPDKPDSRLQKYYTTEKHCWRCGNSVAKILDRM